MPTSAQQHLHFVTKGEVVPSCRTLLVARMQVNVTPKSPRALPVHLRGALAQAYPELDLLHQHGPQGLIYRSPRVIYRVDESTPVVIAIDKGAETLMHVQLVGRTLRLGSVERTILDATLKVSQEKIGETDCLLEYRFRRPWLALNQHNHRRFERMSRNDQTEFLDRQVVNNCLSLARSYDVQITTQLTAEAKLRSVQVRHKGLPMVGFVGTFAINFYIPDGMGLGKTVSKGFGNVIAQTDLATKNCLTT